MENPDYKQASLKRLHEWNQQHPEALGKRRRAFNQRHPERRRMHQRRAQLKINFGITPEQVEQLLMVQEGRCAICARSLAGTWHKGLYVDHDHVTGQVRGLLCNKCNRGLGFFEDNPQALQRAACYLEKAQASELFVQSC